MRRAFILGNNEAFDIIFWIGAAIFVIFGLLLPLLIFVAAVVEKQHVRTLRPATAEDERRHTLHPILEAAIGMGYDPIGLYGFCDTGRKVKPLYLLLSGDGQVVVRVWLGKRYKPKRYELMTRLINGTWLITSDMLGVRDLSGLRWEQMLPDTPLTLALRHHRQRVCQIGLPCVPLVSAEATVAELCNFEEQRVARLQELGLARYVGGGRDGWAFSIRGAAKLAWQVTKVMERLREDKKRADELKSQPIGALPLK